MGLNRREFIRAGGMGLLVAAGAPGSARAGVTEALAAAARGPSGGAAAGGGAPLLIHVFLRGAADGLHLVPPTGDPGYTKLRGELALNETLPFTRTFSLHPELAALTPLVERRQLAVIHGAGSPDATRSHFEAQDIMEVGGTATGLEDGWLTRGLRGANDVDAFASLALTGEQPLALRGSGAFAIDDPAHFGLPGASHRARSAIEASYRDAGDPAGLAGARALAALSEYERATTAGRTPESRRFARRRRPGNQTLANCAEQLLAIDRSGLGLRAACLESDDWDTHANQGTEQGRMAGRIRDLGDALAALAAGLGSERDWLVVVMTEFGRTVRPNGSRGSDHGHGSVMFVAGPRVRGGAFGDWAGLSHEHLYEGRDLPVLTDWRSVLHEVLGAHIGGAPPADTFPGFTPESLGLVV
jgi:uncharacterized protein (DUF1501 family)